MPFALVTLIVPDAPSPIMAVMLSFETTVNESAALPPKLTDFVPVKLVPTIVTKSPVFPVKGANDVIFGITETVIFVLGS